VEVGDLQFRTRDGNSKETTNYRNLENFWVVGGGFALAGEAAFRWIWGLLLEAVKLERERKRREVLNAFQRAGVGNTLLRMRLICK